jgi:hypothetical protein
MQQNTMVNTPNNQAKSAVTQVFTHTHTHTQLLPSKC